jgi:hypothetical protein
LKSLFKKIFISIPILVILSIVLFILLHFNDIRKNGNRNIPKNRLSNSISFNAKVDHAMRSEVFRKAGFLVMGSSLSLNNISAGLLNKNLKLPVYNFSSWGFRPINLLSVLSAIKKRGTQQLLVAFNNVDFGRNEIEISVQGFDAYLRNDRPGIWIHQLRTFNISNFKSDWSDLEKIGNEDNVYESLDFDTFGSCLINAENFSIDSIRWQEYHDTTNFHIYLEDTQRLKKLCDCSGIQLILMYLPWRSDLLDDLKRKQNNAVACAIRSIMKNDFIDLHELILPARFYCDGSHLFREGAEFITNASTDSIKKILP